MTVFMILTIDWLVPFLKWDINTCGTEKISYPVSDLWLPDIEIKELMDEDKSQSIPYLQINYTGGLHLVKVKRIPVSCQLNIYRFPFDVQECSITFLSLIHEEDEMILTSKSVEFSTNSSVDSDSGWKLEDLTKCNFTYNLTSIRSFSCQQYNLTLSREASLYVVNLLVPSCFLSLLDLCSFILPPQNMDRSAFKMTLILGYTVFLIITNDILPKSVSPTPLINVFFSLSLGLMVASLLETMLIVNLSNFPNKYPKVPRWVHVLILDFLGRLLFISHKCPDAQVEVVLNSNAKAGNPDITAMMPSLTGEKDEREGSAVVNELKKVAQDLLTIRLRVEEHLRPKQAEIEWNLIANVIDRFLFLIYILFVIASYITIIVLWSSS
ncbi:5-hydroxytryptamine receptor 3A-like isoform X1 [Silurus meridionalis]|uniref:5-hydroxytryptamine receptor 3A-like isoform X1 n=2 Tax=Silurus meridionalis TaxID=175797 RepID=UPI001EEBA83F|nr:5-hydroxytryptamine receptor 3A-like isoform X1 [Silurus meridionalis]